MLNSLSISNRINLGFASLTLLIVMMTALAYFSVTTLGDVYKSYRGTAKQTITINEFVEDLFQARTAALAYRSNPSQERADAVTGNLDEISRDAQDLSNFADSPDAAERITEIAADSAIYRSEFVRMRELTAERLEMHQALVTQGDALDAGLADAAEAAYLSGDIDLLRALTAAEIKVLYGLAYAEQIVVLPASDVSLDIVRQDFATAQAEMSKAVDVVNRVPGVLIDQSMLEAIADVSDQLSALQALADEMFALTAEIAAIQRDTLDSIGPDMQLGLEAIAESIVARQDTLGPEGQEIVEQTLWITPIMGLISLAIAAFLSWAIGRAITVPVKRLTHQTVTLSKGDTNFEVEGAEHNHELGQMAGALASFQQAYIDREASEQAQAEARKEQEAVVSELSERLRELANGALDARVDAHFAPEYAALKENFNQALDNLDGTISKVVRSSRSIGETASSISEGSMELSSRTESQAATLEEASAALQELTEAVQTSATRAKEVEDKIKFTREDAKSSEAVMSKAVSAMKTIAESSHQISTVTEVISDISFQTNLLALNAGVEAARAGDAGRGFAVVALEVGALAQRSAEAVQEVSELISTSSDQVSKGTELVNQAGDALGNIVSHVDQISELILEITTSTSDQATGISEINSGVAQLDQVTQQNASMVEMSTAQGSSIANDATGLRRMMDGFRVSADAEPHASGEDRSVA